MGNDGFQWDEVLTRSNGIAGGTYTLEVQERLSSILAGATVRLTTSGTSALEMAGILVGFDEGDVAMVPSFGFVTTALAFVRAGARIRYVDIDPTTLGMDPADVDRKMDASVKAVVPIHYAGYPCHITGVIEASQSFRALVVEDNAHGLFGRVGTRPLGTLGALGCLSFHGTKNLSCGEGGAIVINDGDLVPRAEVVLEKGTDRHRFLRGEVDKYTWQDMGSSFGMGDYLAAVLMSQLEQAESIQERRRHLSELYVAALQPHAETLRFTLPRSAPGEVPAYHLFFVTLSSPELRDDVVAQLQGRGVAASAHYPALHQTPGGRKWSDGTAFSCPNSERVADSIVRLPLGHRMVESDVERATDVLVAILSRMAQA